MVVFKNTNYYYFLIILDPKEVLNRLKNLQHMVFPLTQHTATLHSQKGGEGKITLKNQNIPLNSPGVAQQRTQGTTGPGPGPRPG